MAGNIEHHPVGGLDEEAPHFPRLVGQRMHDRKATPHRLGMDRVDVGDLDGDLRYHRRRSVLAHDAELGGRVARGLAARLAASTSAREVMRCTTAVQPE
jgi:hypothetical protein